MNRFSAAGIHLGLSALIFVVLAYWVLFVWYPGMFFETDGGWRGMRIILFVDLVLGPALTLVVFDIKKPELKRDLAVIGFIQFSSLFAGTYVVYFERPISVVYDDTRFYVMSAGSYEDMGREAPDLNPFPGTYPKWVMLDLPDDPEAESKARAKAMSNAGLVIGDADLYIPFNANDPRFSEATDTLEKIQAKTRSKAVLDTWLTEQNRTVADFNFYTFSSRYVYSYIAFEPGSSTPAGLLDLNIIDVLRDAPAGQKEPSAQKKAVSAKKAIRAKAKKPSARTLDR